MRGKDLLRLATIADLVKADFQPQPMGLVAGNGFMRAWYGGSYVAAQVTVPADQTLPEFAVPAAQFAELVGHFSGEEAVSIKPSPSGIVITNGRKKLTLRGQAVPPTFDMDVVDGVTVDRAMFAKELGIAATMAGTQAVKPILTGVRIMAADKRMVFQAANALSIVYESFIDAQCVAPIDVVLPIAAGEMAGVLKILSGDTLSMHTDDKRMVFTSGEDWVRIPLMSGAWPNFAPMRDDFKGGAAVPRAVLSVAAVRSSASAAKILKAGSVLTLKQAEDGMILTTNSEFGDYVELAGGDQQALTENWGFAADDLEACVRVVEGDTLTLEMGKKIARVAHGSRRLYVLTRVPS